MPAPAEPSSQDIAVEMERARRTYQQLLAGAPPTDLRRPSVGTRWTNEQVLSTCSSDT